MRKIKFLFPVLALMIAVIFAFGNKALTSGRAALEKKDNSKFTTTYFVFSGSSTNDYTDSSKWAKHTVNPEEDCNGGNMLACQVHSSSIVTVSELVDYISLNGIDGADIEIDTRKNP